MSEADSPPNTDAASRTGGVVLCGGKSRRMGTSKAWLQFGEEVMLQRITRILADVVDPVVVVAAADQKLPLLNWDVGIVRDEFPELGPLSGIYSGLKELAARNIEFGYVTACDAPFLRPEFVSDLMRRQSPDHDIILLRDGQYSYVLAAIYRSSLHETARRLLDAGQLRPLGLTDHHPTLELDVDVMRGIDPDLSSLLNLNTPEEYQAALARHERESR